MSCNKSFIPFCSAKLFFCVIPTSTASRDHVIQRESSPIYSHCFSLFWWSDCLIVGNQALVSIYFFILPNWLVIFFSKIMTFSINGPFFFFPFPFHFYCLSSKYGIAIASYCFTHVLFQSVANMAARRSGSLLLQRCVFCSRETSKRRRDFDMRRFSRIGTALFVASSRGGIFFASGEKQLIPPYTTV